MKLHPLRYSLVKISPVGTPIPLLISQIRKNITYLSGTRGLSQSSVHIVHSEKKKDLYFILRSRREDLRLIQAAALMLDVGYVEVVRVSGTIKKLRLEIAEKAF